MTKPNWSLGDCNFCGKNLLGVFLASYSCTVWICWRLSTSLKGTLDRTKNYSLSFPARFFWSPPSSRALNWKPSSSIDTDIVKTIFMIILLYGWIHKDQMTWISTADWLNHKKLRTFPFKYRCRHLVMFAFWWAHQKTLTCNVAHNEIE